MEGEVLLYCHGNIDREVAESRLMLFSNSDGTYLIRCKDEVNWVLSIYYRRKIAHYLLVRQANGGFVWDTEHRYTSLHDMVRHHKQEKDGMVALLTVGCPCKIFVMDKQLFPGHSCEGLCWYHGLIEQEECGLRLSLTEPVNGSFLITAPYEQECIYCLAIWVDNDVVYHGVREHTGLLTVLPNQLFPSLLDLISFYMLNPSLGHTLVQPCCVTTWESRELLTKFKRVGSANTGPLTVLSNVKKNRHAAMKRKNFRITKQSSSLSDTECTDKVVLDGIGFLNNHFSSDEETSTSSGTPTLELHNTLSRKGSRRIKRKSLEKSRRKEEKAKRVADNSSEPCDLETNVCDFSPMSEPDSEPWGNLKLRRRNAEHKKKKNRKDFLSQSDIVALTSVSTRHSIDSDSVLQYTQYTDIIGTGVCSNVYEGTYHSARVVLKKCSRTELVWTKALQPLEHDNIVRLIGSEQGKLVVMEVCELGPLDLFLVQHKQRVSPFTILSWLRDVSSALIYLESQCLTLYSIACKHIVINTALTAKLTCYSTSRYLSTQGQYSTDWSTSPELHSLLWSFGATCLEAIQYGSLTNTALAGLEMVGGVPQITFQPNIPHIVQELITACLKRTVSSRPTLHYTKAQLDSVLDIVIKAYSWRTASQPIGGLL